MLSGKVPDEFFDDDVESDQEFFDIMVSLKSKGLPSLTTLDVGGYE